MNQLEKFKLVQKKFEPEGNLNHNIDKTLVCPNEIKFTQLYFLVVLIAMLLRLFLLLSVFEILCMNAILY